MTKKPDFSDVEKAFKEAEKRIKDSVPATDEKIRQEEFQEEKFNEESLHDEEVLMDSFKQEAEISIDSSEYQVKKTSEKNIAEDEKQKLLLQAEQALQFEMEKSSVNYQRSKVFLRWGAIVFILVVLVWFFFKLTKFN